MYIMFSILIYFALLCFFLVWFKWKSKPNVQNPFPQTILQELPLMETELRESVLRNEFENEKLPNHIDAVIIGSGVAALVCAGVMVKAGKSVIVLEMGDKIGGCTNVYKYNGYEYDIGIHYHYGGDNVEGSLGKILMDSLVGGYLTWNDFSSFDNVLVEKDKESCSKSFKYFKDIEICKLSLLREFPGDSEAIEKYFDLLKQSRRVNFLYTITKLVPELIVKLFFGLKLDCVFCNRYNYIISATLEDVLNDITKNETLKLVLSYSFADYGTLPSETSFFVHANLMLHKIETGGFIPRGGANEIIARCILETNKHGGMMFTGAEVKQILFKGGKVCGVEVVKISTNEVFRIDSHVVITNIGIQITLDHLIPKHITDKYETGDILSSIKTGSSYCQVMIALKGTSDELNLPTTNFWIHSTNNTEKEMKKYLSLPLMEALNSDFPFLFISFPSARDVAYNERYPGKSTCIISFLSNPEWFSNTEKVKVNGTAYSSLKTAFADKSWKRVLSMYPHLHDKVDRISDQDTEYPHLHLIHCSHGNIYGMGHNLERFQIKSSLALRPQTKILGLYFTGQDIHTVGYMGSVWSGLITAIHLLGHNIAWDLFNLWRSIRKKIN